MLNMTPDLHYTLSIFDLNPIKSNINLKLDLP